MPPKIPQNKPFQADVDPTLPTSTSCTTHSPTISVLIVVGMNRGRLVLAREGAISSSTPLIIAKLEWNVKKGGF